MLRGGQAREERVWELGEWSGGLGSCELRRLGTVAKSRTGQVRGNGRG